jgi:hypothetical protein
MSFDIDAEFKAYERLEDRKKLWYPTFQDIADYTIPRKGNFFGRVEGQKRTQKLFDSTAIHSNELLAASLQGSLTSPIIQWFSMKLTQDHLNADRYVNLWLDECARVLYSVLSHSNFNSEIFEIYLDLGSFGTGCLFAEEASGLGVFNGIWFDSLDIAEYVIDEDKEGYVDTVYRTVPLSARNAFDFFGKKDFAKTSDKLKAALEKRPDERFDFLHVVKPADEKYKRERRNQNFKFASCWYEKEKKLLLREGGYYEFPFFVPRWLKTSGELFGRSPAQTAMPDIKSLNKARELLFRAWGKAIDPPIKVLDDGVIGSVKLTPSGLNVVRTMDALDTLRNEGRFDVSQIEESKLRESIQRIFFTDQLQLQQNGPQMTATEVQIRFELMQRLLGPTFGRMMAELLTPLVRRVFGILWRTGMLPPLPPVLEKMGLANIEIEFEGPLSRAQRSQDVLAVERWFQINTPLITVDPTVVDVLNRDNIAKDSAQVIGMRPSWLRSPEEIAETRAQRAEDVKAQQMQQMAQTVGDVASKTAPMVKTMADNPDAMDSLLGGQG